LEALTAIICPDCKSEKFFRDGLRKLVNGETRQRYICRSCGYRYTSPSILNCVKDNLESSRISAKAKNMAAQETKTTCARDAKLTPDAAGIMTQFLAYLEKQGFSKETEYPNLIRRIIRLGANLRDPETVKEVVGKLNVKNGMKMQYCYAYNAVATMLKIEWDQPKYRQEEIIPFIPDEAELDALINAARTKRLACYLQTLKETYGDPSEVLRIEWIDISEKEQTIKINHPVKGHLPRTLQVSSRLLSMLSCLPHDAPRVFKVKYAGISSTYCRMRKRVAETQKNPRLLAIELRTFRHWGGTQVAWHTNGNVLLVKRLLGHKRIENSMKYIGMINFKADDWETTSATTVEDILKLGQAGWIEYSVVKINSAEVHCFRKPKRFANYV
jgi:integrase